MLRAAEGARLEALIRKLASDERVSVRNAVDAARSRLAGHKREQARLRQLYLMEDTLRDSGVALVAGVDEVGRGALAGPLTAAACILPAQPRIDGLDDSKRLTPARREDIALRIAEVALAYSVSHVPAEDVDALGMTRALRTAMTQAIQGLALSPHHVIVDGRPVGVHPSETAVIKGDSIVAAIAAASIVAKVARDALMRDLSLQHEAYGFDINKGYGTREHMDAISTHGLSPLHRRSFCRGFCDPRLF